MDFRLTDEQQEFQAYVRKFAREVMRPVAAEYDREQKVPYDVVREARKWNLHGLELLQSMATDDGGLKGVIYAEEMHWGCAGIALAISASSLAAAGIAASGTPEQVGQWVPECYGIGDEIKFGAYGVTEAGAGSDVKSLRTTAGGRVEASPAGNRAEATPAASAIGSLPLTRVVLRVALTGKPSC